MTINQRLAEKYPYIVAWGRIMGSYDYYIDMQLERARSTHAPSTATAENTSPTGEDTGTWSTVESCRNPSALRQMKQYVPKYLAEALEQRAERLTLQLQKEREETRVNYLVQFLQWALSRDAIALKDPPEALARCYLASLDIWEGHDA